ncbi:MAG TPA: hypothetical protein VF121_01250 [Thermoanaerobaculia bacterium]|nr:hypothetical protein [Thermoanaerobaculia bacterium]
MTEPKIDELDEEGLAPEEPPKPPLPVRVWRAVRGWLVAFALVFLAILLAEIFKGPLDRFEAALAPHFDVVNRSLIAATAGGVLLFVAGALYLGRHGVSMGQQEVEEMLRRNREAMAGPAVSKRWRYDFHGRSVGRAFDVEMSFRQVKEVLRSAGWWRDPARLSLIAPIAGGLLVVFGGFSLFILHGPAWLKVLLGGWLLYALARFSWAFARA